MTSPTAPRGGFRAVFFGTPEFSVPCLEALAEVATVVAAVCRPDKPVGRGLAMQEPPVKRRAQALGIPVVQPTKLRTGEFAAWLREQNADVALVVAYGRILPQDVLDAPRLGCVNVHASILPKYRGAAPIAWAVVRGEEETGVTLMKMDAGMDTGDMLETWRTPIGDEETAGELSVRLSRLGAEAVRAGLPRYVRGEYVPRSQEHALATTAPMLEKAHGRVDWSRPAREVHDLVRGMNPWPMAQTSLAGKRVILHRTRREGAPPHPAKPGEVVLADKTRVLIACGDDTIDLLTVQLEGKKPMRGADWYLGRGVKEGDLLGS